MHGHVGEHWEWDMDAKSPAARLSPCRRAVYFHTDPVLESEGTAGVRGTKGFSHGEHYWEIEFLEPPCGSSVMVGLGTKKALLHTGNYQFIDLLEVPIACVSGHQACSCQVFSTLLCCCVSEGMDCESWGLSYKGSVWHGGESRTYTQPFYDKSTVIGVLLNLHTGTLVFYRNGSSLGLAFSGLDQVGAPLYPLVSSTAPETELFLGLRTCRFTSLQEHCLQAIAQTLGQRAVTDRLPLPAALQEQLGVRCGHPSRTLLGVRT
ncbi:SPRY domain-containing SOCS box protein 3 isoform X1 [Lepisosteus oculatus]|uniref:SPRY domain-containing SOCS box protein 3 isoform X1 n=1 Tax=Lepisosteus oculatus TaxID=7918 RepID=UPI0035F51EB7